MLNKCEIVDVDVWDEETGESDLIIKLKDNIQLKGFCIDECEKAKEKEVFLSLFCKDYEIKDNIENFTSEILNINDKYETKLQGKITSHVVSEEEGEYITVDCNGIFVTVFYDFEEKSNFTDKFFIGNGRLDIEIHEEEW